jgi:hypothetical protein
MNAKCPQCGNHIDVEKDLVGQHMPCPRCQHRFEVTKEPRRWIGVARDTHPALRLAFFLICLAVLGAVGAAVVYYGAALFRAGE